MKGFIEALMCFYEKLSNLMDFTLCLDKVYNGAFSDILLERIC